MTSVDVSKTRVMELENLSLSDMVENTIERLLFEYDRNNCVREPQTGPLAFKKSASMLPNISVSDSTCDSPSYDQQFNVNSSTSARYFGKPLIIENGGDSSQIANTATTKGYLDQKLCPKTPDDVFKCDSIRPPSILFCSVSSTFQALGQYDRRHNSKTKTCVCRCGTETNQHPHSDSFDVRTKHNNHRSMSPESCIAVQLESNARIVSDDTVSGSATSVSDSLASEYDSRRGSNSSVDESRFKSTSDWNIEALICREGLSCRSSLENFTDLRKASLSSLLNRPVDADKWVDGRATIMIDHRASIQCTEETLTDQQAAWTEKSTYKASDKMKKKLQQRYFSTQQTPDESQAPVLVRNVAVKNASTEDGTTHRVGRTGDIFSRRTERWNKRHMAKIRNSDMSKVKKVKKFDARATNNMSAFQDCEQNGYIQYDSDEDAEQPVTQDDIRKAVDVSGASKIFDLKLHDFGPYHLDYTRNGRHLLLGGNRGHVAAFDWQTKKLHCEFNAMETVNSVKWMHQETLFTVAQRSGVFMYDNQGIEIHPVPNLDCVLRQEFLPYHMLLVTSNEKGFLAYTDISMGTRVAGICTGLGRLDVMAQNSSNAIIHMGHAAGTVSLWTPSHKDYVMKILCHKAPIRAIAINSTGNYMATAGADKRLKVFDLRTKGLLSSTHCSTAASSLSFSQRGLLSASFGAIVQVYNDAMSHAPTRYLSHRCDGTGQAVQFCPFEDVLGVGHQKGFTSLVVPGAGEANVDALEVNPLATKRQRQHAEVKLLLDKLQPEMIGLDNWVDVLLSEGTATTKPAKHNAKKITDRRKSGVRDESNPLSRFRKSTV